MSISRGQRARLGVFVTAGTGLLIAFAIVSIGMQLGKTSKTYFAYFQGESLSGLEQGATVKYSGVPIGKVDRISYTPKDLSKVKVAIKVQSDFPMKKGMYATTDMLGITGLKYVEILGGDSRAVLLKAGSEIPTRPSTFGAISGKAEAIMNKVELLLNNLNALSNPDSLRSLRMMLDNVAAITNDARLLMHNVAPQVDTISRITTNLIGKIDLIAGDVNAFTGSLDSVISAGTVANTLALIDSSATSLKLLSDNLALMILQSREDVTVTMENIRDASESANQLAKMLAENPSLLLKGEAQKERGGR